MAGRELDADNLHPDRLMASVKMIDWMKLNASVTHKDAEIARLRAELDAAKAERDTARAALDKEREACHAFYAAGTRTWRAGVDLTKTIHAESFWAAWDAYAARRAAEANRLDAYYSDPASRVRVPVDGTEYYRKRAAEAKEPT